MASELQKRATGRTLYVLDEPTTGLHFEDIRKLLGVLGRLVDAGNTVVVIEHNLDVIKTADWLIDMGPEGGSRGGLVIAEGTPEQIAANPKSYTGAFLKPMLEGQAVPIKAEPAGARRQLSKHVQGSNQTAAYFVVASKSVFTVGGFFRPSSATSGHLRKRPPPDQILRHCSRNRRLQCSGGRYCGPLDCSPWPARAPPRWLVAPPMLKAGRLRPRLRQRQPPRRRLRRRRRRHPPRPRPPKPSASKTAKAPKGPSVATSKVPVGGGVILQDADYVVTQPSKGKYKAFSKICTHQGCPVARGQEWGHSLRLSRQRILDQGWLGDQSAGSQASCRSRRRPSSTARSM